MTKAELMALIDQRDALDDTIEKAMTELGLDKKGLKAMTSAAKKAAAAKKTLDALMGLDLEPSTGGAAEGDLNA